MNAAQKKFLSRTVRNILLITVLGIVLSASHKWLFLDLISGPSQAVQWAAFVLFVIAAWLARRTEHIPTRAERHAAFNEIMDEYPLLRMLYVVYAIVIVIGLLYMLLTHIYFADVLDETGFLGLAGLVLILGVPVGIARFLRSYEEAGREDQPH